MKNIIIFIGLALFTGSIAVSAQEKFRISPTESSLKVKGTSSIHDWEMELKNMKGDAGFVIEQNKIKELKSSEFISKVENLESDNSTMNKKAHKALRSEKHPEISFKSSSIKLSDHSTDNFSGTVTGTARIGGESKTLSIPFKGELTSNNYINIKGEAEIKMSDFNIDPPTAMLGALKTGNQVTVEFQLSFYKEDRVILLNKLK